VFPAVLAGLGAGASLIIAIGAQNAFVLRQGLARRFVLLVVAVCAVSDIVLISIGTAGLAGVSSVAGWALPVMKWGGVCFLVVYGFLALRRALKPRGLTEAESGGAGWWPVLLTCLALTWLNPHVYLDTVVLLGSLAVTHRPYQWWFAAGAIAASCVWFPVLGYGARWLRPLFASPKAWRILDVVIALVMWGIALSLILQG